jgi:predicted enzyme related to lactoylglutathione lyase
MPETTSVTKSMSALSWFEIPTSDFDRARAFYRAILETDLPANTFGPARIAIFAYENGGVGGCIDEGSLSQPGATGTIVYLDVTGRLERTLELVEAAGGRIAEPKTALPPGMGFTAHIIDTEGNRVGLHTH